MTVAILYMLGGALLTILAGIGLKRVAGFAAQRPEDYARQGPDFDIRRHLNGPLRCDGVIYGPMGRVSARFTAEMNATWDGNTGHMTEDFVYDSGATQHREWALKLDAGGRIVATAPDLVGEGSGAQKGAGVMLRYRIRLPETSGGHVLDAVDWMYLIDGGTIINRSQFRKFGITVAELVATLRPVAHENAVRNVASMAAE